MFSFFKNKKKDNSEEQNVFLDVENAVFNTEVQETNVTSVVESVPVPEYQTPEVVIPAYKASNTNSLGIVIDSEQLGFNKDDLHDNLKTIEFEPPKEKEENTVMEPVKSIEQTPVVPIVKEQENSLEVIDIDFSNEQNISIPQTFGLNSNEEVPSVSDEFTIFGSQDGIAETKNHSVEDYVENSVELNQDVRMTQDGHKICPNCGAILNATAPVCFMCSKSFVLRR